MADESEKIKVEVKTEEEPGNGKKPRSPWIYSTGILVLIVIAMFGMQMSGMFISTNGANGIIQNQMSPQDAGKKAVDFINENLVQPGNQATLASVAEMSGIYNVTTEYMGNKISVYITKDGRYLIVPGFGAIDLDTFVPPEPEPEEPSGTETPKSDKPVLDLFVWAFCPGGVSGESVLKPVYDLLKNKAEINVHFIGPITESEDAAAGSCFAGRGLEQDQALEACCDAFEKEGKTFYSCALHNRAEAQESQRQVCVIKEYGKDKFWEYVSLINQNCYQLYTDSNALETCWRNAAKTIGIDPEKIATCSKSLDALELVKADNDLADQYGISSSPSFLINGERYSGSRAPEDLKQAVCSAFNTPPSECSQTLGAASGSNPSGSCG